MIKAAQQWTFDALTPILDSIRKPKIFVPCGFSGLFNPEYAGYFRKMPDWLRKFDRLIFYATNYRDINMAREHGIDWISIIPNGADEREFQVDRDPGFRARNGIAADAFVILTVGTLTGFKGHLELAHAFEQCDFSGRRACLILNGNTPRPSGSKLGLRARVDALFAGAAAMHKRGGPFQVAKWLCWPVLVRLGLGPSLQRLGYGLNTGSARAPTLKDVVRRINALPNRQAMLSDFARPELIQAYLASDLFVFASKIEYSPLVLYEAAAAGLPFLTAPVGNAAEIAEWTGAGVVYPATIDADGHTQVDVHELAAHISRLAREPGTLARLGEIGRRNWEAQFTWDRISRLYEAVFEECLEKVET
ncbi:MAG TPA: glycosyltransferase family 4 protein [Burkholderiales bacterium]|nr:glycosyltransferase family 4 protein [Burkholderiales bacterium]